MKRMMILTFFFAAAFAASLAALRLAAGQDGQAAGTLMEADNPNIQYTGRVDFADPKKPRFWSPGVTVTARFQGPDCDILVNDEVLYGKSHNFVEIVVDDRPPVRVQTTGAVNVLRAARGLPPGPHTVTLCKDTEAGIGYLEFVGFRCARLLPPPPRPTRRMEFIGDSITCGASSDLSVTPCGQGEWYAQNNAYLSYGMTTARLLHAEAHLTSVSGIGLMHSCCDMKTTLPDVFDKMNLSRNSGHWDFARYQPDAVTICLGQNDGQQDGAQFEEAYVRFIGTVRATYPKAQIFCLSSPMADAALTAYMKEHLARVVERVHAGGDPNVHTFFFSRHYGGGCGGHPDVAAHSQMAAELSAALHPTLGWSPE